MLEVHSDALLILVPRHPERFAAVHDLCAGQFATVRRSTGDVVTAQTQVLLGDTMGELLFLYALADIAFVGGSLVATGGHNPLEGTAHGMTAVRHVPGIVIAALGTLGFGLVLGPEAPVLALGSATGVAVSNMIRAGQQERAILSSAGQFSAVSTLFGGPLVGGVMITEVGIGLGAALIPALLPGFVAAAVGYLIFVGLGPYTGAPAPGLTVPDLDVFVGITLVDLIVAVGIGIATAIVLAGVNRIARRLGVAGPARLGPGARGMTVFLLAGGLAVGGLALLARALGVDPRDVLFSGQTSIPNLVSLTSVSALAILLVAKALAYIVSLASGFRGGPIFPALFLGIGVAAWRLGAGRARKEDPVSAGAGVLLRCRPGDAVTTGQVLMELHADDRRRIPAALDLARAAVTVAEAAPPVSPLVLDRVGAVRRRRSGALSRTPSRTPSRGR